jgi:hypothetical protein
MMSLDNKQGLTAYDIAVKTNNQHCAELLQKAMNKNR